MNPLIAPRKIYTQQTDSEIAAVSEYFRQKKKQCYIFRFIYAHQNILKNGFYEKSFESNCIWQQIARGIQRKRKDTNPDSSGLVALTPENYIKTLSKPNKNPWHDVMHLLISPNHSFDLQLSSSEEQQDKYQLRQKQILDSVGEPLDNWDVTPEEILLICQKFDIQAIIFRAPYPLVVAMYQSKYGMKWEAHICEAIFDAQLKQAKDDREHTLMNLNEKLSEDDKISALNKAEQIFAKKSKQIHQEKTEKLHKLQNRFLYRGQNTKRMKKGERDVNAQLHQETQSYIPQPRMVNRQPHRTSPRDLMEWSEVQKLYTLSPAIIEQTVVYCTFDNRQLVIISNLKFAIENEKKELLLLEQSSKKSDKNPKNKEEQEDDEDDEEYQGEEYDEIMHSANVVYLKQLT